jgi:hypothetical protein
LFVLDPTHDRQIRFSENREPCSIVLAAAA